MAVQGEPMKAKLTAQAFDDPGWIFERKLDGERAIVERTPKGVVIRSRTGRRMDNYPELTEAFEAESTPSFVVDGEIVAFDGRATSFEKLQGRMGIADGRLARLTGIKVFIYVFDLLELEGRDVTGLPLRERKSLLRKALEFHGPVRYTQHRNEKGRKFFLEACTKGWEGLVAKRVDSTYTHTRSNDWLKVKCTYGQELVIGGYTPPKGSRERFGALLVGYNEGGDLRYAGTRWTPCARRRPRSPPAPACPATRSGSSPSWSASSASASGPATASSATPVTSACATTSGRAKWCASCRPRRRRASGVRNPSYARITHTATGSTS
jgi:bifunctional non-homologous end joining protein LigD